MKPKKLKKLPEVIRNRVMDLVNGMRDGEYRRGFINGVKFLLELQQEMDDFIEKESVKKAEKWFEEEVVPVHGVDDLYTSELSEKGGIAFLSNIREEWAHKFFARVELEKEKLRDEYSQETKPKGENSRESLGL